MAGNISIPFIKEWNSEPPREALKVEINCHNWSKDYPSDSEAFCHMWHSGDLLYLDFSVKEEFVRAEIGEDNGKVSKDSCVEFFISFDKEGYYNIEANSIGKVLMSHRKSRKENVIYAPGAVLDSIKRVASLGSEPFECKKSDGIWRLSLQIPLKAFFVHDFESFKGLKARANFYKCGDLLPHQHFLSWQPIDTETPDFHRPEYFGDIEFQSSPDME